MMESVWWEPCALTWAIAASSPSTTPTEMIASRYSVPQSAASAGTTRESSARARSSPRTSQPASNSGSRIAGSASSMALSTRSVSAAPQIPVRRILALKVTSRAVAGSAAACTYTWQTPSRCAITGTRLSSRTRSIRERPPRGTIRSTASSMASRMPTAARSVVGTSWMQPAGSPASARAARSAAAMAREECQLSEPPRRITALPDMRQSAPASAVTLGRDS